MATRISKELLPKGYAKRTVSKMTDKGITKTKEGKNVNARLIYNVAQGVVSDDQVLANILELIEDDREKAKEVEQRLKQASA